MRDLGLVAGACGGLPERFVAELAEPAAAMGWRLAITLTPTAYTWMADSGKLPALRALTDLPVRSTSRMPNDERPHPDPEVFLFAPATASSVAKLALGIADNQALTVLGDALGVPGITTAVGYQVRDSRIHHPAWQGHLDTLLQAGVHLHNLQPTDPLTAALKLLPRP